ncbi:hypothetical protein C8R43DRAFT_1120126 [Mycena crocata]|nr:hypothetical protein C8R43DRAFT_1120126 [Mycena crocata]
MCFLWLVIVLSLFLLSSALNIITVDDSASEIIYEPPNAWMLGAIGGCSGCLAPSPQFASQNTWHGSLFNPGNHRHDNNVPLRATFPFFGTSVSVSCILSNSLDNPVGTSEMAFTIDGIRVGVFSHTATGASGFVLNNTVFISGTLPLQNHTLVIQNGKSGGGPSLVILDSITYSVDTVPSAPLSRNPVASSSATPAGNVRAAKTSPNAAPIVGGVFAALAVLLLLGLAFLYVRHRRNQHRSNVPLSTTIVAPIGRIRNLWSGGPPRPPPDMAPVPFPTPAQHLPVSISPSPRPPPPAPAPNTSRSRISRISFNANLLVGRFNRRPPPPAISTRRQAPDVRAAGLSAPASPALLSGNPLLRQPPAQPEPHNVVTSIQEWQRRTLEETANEPVIHPLDMSEVDLSSHYDESTVSSPPPPAPPPPRSPQPPQRRFTVMNN